MSRREKHPEIQNTKLWGSGFSTTGLLLRTRVLVIPDDACMEKGTASLHGWRVHESEKDFWDSCGCVPFLNVVVLK